MGDDAQDRAKADTGGLLPRVRDEFDHGGKGAIWKWAIAPEGAHSKAKRFGAAAHFAGNRRDLTRGAERKRWADDRREYAAERDKYEARYEARHDDREWWPASLVVAECLYHYPGPHFHLATPERDKLIGIAGIAKARGIRVGEFPPFDPVECVHTEISWHYRDSSNPYIGRTCAQRGDGCAADMNDADGGNDLEYALYLEVRRRYLAG